MTKPSLQNASPGDWALIIGLIGTALGGLIGITLWLADTNAKASDAVTSNTDLKAQVMHDRDAQEKRDDAIFSQMRDVNTRLSRIEGLSRVTLKEVRNAAQ